MKFLRVLMLSCGLLWLAHAAPAQTPRDASPEAIAQAMYAAMQRGDMRAAAALFDPEALKDFRAMLMPVIDEAPAAQRDAVIAALFCKQAAQTLEHMDDAAFFACYLSGAMALSGGKLESSEVLGSVAEGDDLRHVATRARASAGGIGVTRMDVVSLRRTPQGWRVLLKGEMTGMAEAMRARLKAAGRAGGDR